MLVLTLDEDISQNIASLYQWFLDDPDIRRTATLTLADSTPEAGTMGGAFDIINLAVTSSFSAASLAVAFATWKDAHRKGSWLIARNGDFEAVIEDASEDSIQKLVQVLSHDPQALTRALPIRTSTENESHEHPDHL